MKRILFVLLALCATSAHAELVLREDTASQAVVLGPFVDDTGAPVTDLTIANTDVRVSVNGGNIAAKNSGGCTHDELGMYTCTFDATDTATVGRMQVIVVKTGALPVYHEFQVVEEAVYDACCAADAAPATPASIWAAASRTLTALDEDTTTIDLNSSAIGSVTGNVGGTVNGLTSTAQGHVRTAVGLSSANLDTQLSTIAGYIDTEIASLLDGVNVTHQTGIEICGSGTEADPWGACEE